MKAKVKIDGYIDRLCPKCNKYKKCISFSGKHISGIMCSKCLNQEYEVE